MKYNKNKIGGKAYNLQEISQYDVLNIPPFFIVSNEHYDDILNNNVIDLLKNIQEFLTINNIEVFSVRSSPVYSMPGTMDTLLNVTIDSIYESLLQIAKSYYNDTAILYRKLQKIPNEQPGIIIQKMVYGNKNDNSGTGILFTRNNNGKRELFGEYIEQTCGNELVSNTKESVINHQIFEQYKKTFEEIVTITETHFKSPQEIEFTIQDGIVYVLQSRILQFNNLIQLTILLDLYEQGVLTTEEYDVKIKAFLKDKKYKYITQQSNNYIQCKTVSSGIVSSDNILLKNKILNDDLELLQKYDGIITFEGSVTSHPAILCRNLNIPYVIVDVCHKSLLEDTNYIIDGYRNIIIFDNVQIKTIDSNTDLTIITNYIKTHGK